MDAREWCEARGLFFTGRDRDIVEAYAAAKVEEIAGGLAEALQAAARSEWLKGVWGEWHKQAESALAAYHEAVGKV